MLKLIAGNVWTKVQCVEFMPHQLVWESLAYKVPNWWIVAKRAGIVGWDGRKSMYDNRQHIFLTGLLPTVTAMLRAAKVQHEVLDARKQPQVLIEPHHFQLGDISLYDYQQDAVRAFFRGSGTACMSGRGIERCATGSGKTEIAAGITKVVLESIPSANVLFLTHRSELLNQTAARFAKRLPQYAKHIGKVGNQNFKLAKITVATVQTLDRVLSRYEDMLKDPKEFSVEAQREIKSRYANVKSLLEGTTLLIIDEAHRSGSKQFSRPAGMCINACFRCALTATAFMKSNPADNLMLQGIAGPIVADVASGGLIADGTLARPLFKFQAIDHPSNLKALKVWRDIYEHGIVRNEYRNKFIALQTKKLVEMGKHPLIIVSEVQHGMLVSAMLAAMGISGVFLQGMDKVEARQTQLNNLSKGLIDFVIATNILDEGVDVKEIDAIVLAAGGKAPIALFQRVGRAIRKKEENNYAIIIDFIDKQHPKLLEHSMHRYNLVKNENGFTVLGDAA